MTEPHDDVVSLITQDHAAVKMRFAEFDTVSPESRSELFWKLTDQLVRHEAAEQEIVYPAIKRLPGGEPLVAARMKEEEEAEAMLAKLEHLDASSLEFMGALGDLRIAVLDHAQQEEAEVLPLLVVNESMAALTLLGQKFKGAKLAAPNRPHPHLPHGPHANKVLGPVTAFIDRLREGVRSA